MIVFQQSYMIFWVCTSYQSDWSPPKVLSNEQIATRASVCIALLKCFRSKDDFLLHLVTVDETGFNYYEPGNKVGRAWVPEAKEV